MTQRDKILNYVAQAYDIKPDFPWKDSRYAVLRHHDTNKWFGLVMNVKQEHLGLKGDARVDILNIKAQPELVGSLRLNKGFLPAYHMNKEHWVTILLEGSVSIKEIRTLIDTSYDLTKNN